MQNWNKNQIFRAMVIFMKSSLNEKKRKIIFAYVSEHCAYFGTKTQFWGGRGCMLLIPVLFLIHPPSKKFWAYLSDDFKMKQRPVVFFTSSENRLKSTYFFEQFLIIIICFSTISIEKSKQVYFRGGRWSVRISLTVFAVKKKTRIVFCFFVQHNNTCPMPTIHWPFSCKEATFWSILVSMPSIHHIKNTDRDYGVYVCYW